MFVGKVQEHLKVALLTNIRLGWQGLPGTDTLAYNKHWSITEVKVL